MSFAIVTSGTAGNVLKVAFTDADVSKLLPEIVKVVPCSPLYAVGETVAIFYVLNLSFNINWANVLETEGGAVASWILARFGEASPAEKSGLMAAGLVLFVITLIINFIANWIVSKAQPWRKN